MSGPGLPHASALALAVQAAFYGGLVALMPAAVAPWAWVGLYAVVLVATLAALRGPWRSPSVVSAATWLMYAVLLSLWFFGANVGLDALHGAHRSKADVALHLGGLELWFVLCPGAASVALALLVQALQASSARRPKAGSMRSSQAAANEGNVATQAQTKKAV